MNYTPALVGAAAVAATTFYPMNSTSKGQDQYISGGVGSYRFEMPAIITLHGNHSLGALPTAQSQVSDTESEFFKFAQKWKEETGGESSLSRITGNRYYLKIISLGAGVVPLILRELQKEPAPWFVALRVLTDELNVGKNAPGNFRSMADAWLKWGADSKHI